MADRQDIDALMVGALYGEIDAAERSRLDAHLSSHPEDKAALDALERTRAEVRRGLAEMHLADPPPSLTQTLLAAARAARPADVRGAVEAPSSRAAGPGLWTRFVEWMRPIAGHPAFAGAAVLVLVAGTASALWLRDSGKATEPELEREHAAYEQERGDEGDFARTPADEAPSATGATPPTAPGADDSYADNGYALQ